MKRRRAQAKWSVKRNARIVKPPPSVERGMSCDRRRKRRRRRRIEGRGTTLVHDFSTLVDL